MTVSTPILYVLDFDGVVCDGLDECLLTAWIAFKRLPNPEWTIDLLDEIPTAFKEQFRRSRNFVRHDGHFLVPFMTSDPLQSSATFEAFYSTIASPLRDEFRDSFRLVRNRIRQEHFDDWIGLHRFFETMIAALRRMQILYIVSGKDADSISAILASNNIIVPSDHIFGGQTSKISVLLHLKQQADVNHQRIVFCDDNLANALEARTIGIDTFWALWGYHTAEELGEAGRLAIRAIDLDEVEAVFAS